MTHHPLEHLLGIRKAVAAAVITLSAPAALAQTGPHFIHGSWVNVREAAGTTAKVLDQLVTNTPVKVLARQGDWCQLRYGAAKGGFVACNLLGPLPLTLAQAIKAPARAFWIAPSPNRLAAYGLSLTPPAALQLDALKKTLQAGATVRYPAVAEFEAAKRRLKVGVTLDPAQELARPDPVGLPPALTGTRLRPAPIRPSLFRAPESVVLVSEADADGVVAVAGVKVSLTPTGQPMGWFSRHNGPEIEGVTGFWDVGSAELSFDPPISVYTVGANGLVAATALRKLPFEVGGEGHYCGARYTGKSLPYGDWLMHAGTSVPSLDAAPLKGYPVLKEGTEPLVSLVVRGKPLAPSAHVRTQSEPVKRLKSGDGWVDAARLETLKPKIVLRELDLDADGVADVLMVESPLEAGAISVDVIVHRSWYLNLNGRWVPAGDWEDEDCT